MQVCGVSQSFNMVNQMRILGRWMRMFTIPSQSSVPKAWQEFDDEGRMNPSPWYDRIVDVTDELFKDARHARLRNKRSVGYSPFSKRTPFTAPCSGCFWKQGGYSTRLNW